MKKQLAAYILALFITLFGYSDTYAQSPVGYMTAGNGAPSGSCVSGLAYTDTASGLLWSCAGGVWKLPTKQTLTSTYTVSSSTLTNMTGLSVPVAANTNYGIICFLTYQVSSTSTVPQINFTGPASPTSVLYSSVWQVSASAAPVFAGAVATAFSTTQGASPTAATTNFALLIHLGLLNGSTAGTVQLQGAASVSGSFTVQAGSWCAVQ